jgi:hypothetical protein
MVGVSTREPLDAAQWLSRKTEALRGDLGADPLACLYKALFH